MLIQALLYEVEYAIQAYTCPKAASVPVSTRKALPLMVVFVELVAEVEKLVVWHGLNPSITTTSRYFSTKFVPDVIGNVTCALLSERTASDVLEGNMNLNPYLEFK